MKDSKNYLPRLLKSFNLLWQSNVPTIRPTANGAENGLNSTKLRNNIPNNFVKQVFAAVKCVPLSHNTYTGLSLRAINLLKVCKKLSLDKGIAI